ncbi:MAG TPA: glycosyltransferase [Vicinamibacterales bacterium]|nr:glycosyltransferase [Acidobacteriota bacterium]HOC17590.1 glycosyltransferase [Vicinamibacterales bacterium]
MSRDRRRGLPRIALVHDWLTGMRGGEKVLEALCELYPEAPVFTMVHVPGTESRTIARHHPRGAWLSRLPGVGRYYRHLLPLFPLAAETFDLDEFDLVISSSHCAVKSIVRPGRARHLSYCHTPMRYVWDQRDAYFGPERLGRAGSRALRPVLAWLARWDAATAGRVDRYLANSQHVARRIHRYYNRRAEVVAPPVDTGFFHPDGRLPGDFALAVSALAPYKRLDVAIEGCRLAGIPLRIVGWGPEERRLRAQARGGAELLGTLSDEEIRELYRSCAMVLLPGEEDFGIVPVEAQACGRPVVAAAAGGALETVVDGTTGVLVAPGSAEALAEGIRRVRATRFDEAVLRRHAEAFGRERFKARISAIVDETLASGASPTTW